MKRKPLGRCEACNQMKPIGSLRRDPTGAKVCPRCREPKAELLVGGYTIAPVRPLQRPEAGALTLFSEWRERAREAAEAG